MTDVREAPAGTTVAGALPPAQMRLAVAHAVRDRLPLSRILGCLWRTDPAEVSAAYDDAIFGRVDLPDAATAGRHGLLAERMRELRRPLPTRRKRGLTITEIAAQAGVERETLACLMEHHGYLELVPFGGTQRRRLVTDQAFDAGLGHNADASRVRVAVVEGRNRAGVFPVFYPEHVPAILWTLDHAGISTGAAAIKGKRGKLCWLLDNHGHLPTAELASLSGYSRRGVEKARSPSGLSPVNRVSRRPAPLAASITCVRTFMPPEHAPALAASQLSRHVRYEGRQERSEPSAHAQPTALLSGEVATALHQD